MAHIVLIDDDTEMRSVLKEWLKRGGHQVSTAADGARGLELCRTSPAEVAIVDLFMPGKDGLEVIDEIRRDLPEIRVIAISGGGRLDGVEYLPLATTLGAEQTLAKPFTRDELIASVQSVLQSQQPS